MLRRHLKSGRMIKIPQLVNSKVVRWLFFRSPTAFGKIEAKRGNDARMFCFPSLYLTKDAYLTTDIPLYARSGKMQIEFSSVGMLFACLIADAEKERGIFLQPVEDNRLQLTIGMGNGDFFDTAFFLCPATFYSVELTWDAESFTVSIANDEGSLGSIDVPEKLQWQASSPILIGRGFCGNIIAYRIILDDETVLHCPACEANGDVIYNCCSGQPHGTAYGKEIWGEKSWQNLKNPLATCGFSLYESDQGLLYVPDNEHGAQEAVGNTFLCHYPLFAHGYTYTPCRIDFSDDKGSGSTLAGIREFNRNNEDYWTDAARSDYDPGSPFLWQNTQLTKKNIEDWSKTRGLIYLKERYNEQHVLTGLSNLLVFKSDATALFPMLDLFFEED